MENKTITLTFQPEEYGQLEQDARKAGLPLKMYMKKRLLPDNPLFNYYQQLVDMVEQLPHSVTFTIPMLFSTSWEKVAAAGRGRQLGKQFNEAVRYGILTNCKAIGKNGMGIMQYVKL